MVHLNRPTRMFPGLPPCRCRPDPLPYHKTRDVFLGSEAERASPWKSRLWRAESALLPAFRQLRLVCSGFKSCPHSYLMHISSLAKSRKAATTSLPLLLHSGPPGHCHACSGHGNSPGLLPPVPHCPPRSRAGVPFKATSMKFRAEATTQFLNLSAAHGRSQEPLLESDLSGSPGGRCCPRSYFGLSQPLCVWRGLLVPPRHRPGTCYSSNNAQVTSHHTTRPEMSGPGRRIPS